MSELQTTPEQGEILSPSSRKELKDLRVGVVGASGFVGTQVVRGLISAGADVVCVAREGAPLEPEFRSIERAELGDPNALARAFTGCDAVVHSAGIRNRQTDREKLGWTHVAGTENVVAACFHAGVSRLVFVSCASVSLSAEPRDAWNEDRAMSVSPFDAHAETLLEAEGVVMGAGATLNSATARLEPVVLRPSLVWGPGGSTKHNVGTTADFRLEAKRHGALRLFGRGQKLISTTYVENLAHAVRLALVSDEAVGAALHILDEELNLAGDFYTNLSAALGVAPPRRSIWPLPVVRTFAAMGRALSDGTPDAVVLQRAQGNALSGALARKLLGYKPPVSRIDGMAELASWVQSTMV